MSDTDRDNQARKAQDTAETELAETAEMAQGGDDARVEQDVSRDERGRYMPGVSGNPSGRPRGIPDRRSVVNALLRSKPTDQDWVDYFKSLEAKDLKAHAQIVAKLIPTESALELSSAVDISDLLARLVEIEKGKI